MGKIIEGLFSWSAEDLRQEFCLEYGDSKLMALRISQIKDKFKEINEMMDRQLEVNRSWDKNAQKSTKGIIADKSKSAKVDNTKK